ncbi:hypothetical protein, partial [uncultured Aggregatibacter sp.]|uniref:hypothetical protein n=1 Tax=uncultured Aggregatibacter sp. TaxID=470564 RepID=UPI0025D1DF99
KKKIGLVKLSVKFLLSTNFFCDEKRKCGDKKACFLCLDDGNGSKSMRTFIVIDVIRFCGVFNRTLTFLTADSGILC